MNEELLEENICFRVIFFDSKQERQTRNFIAYSDAERFALIWAKSSSIPVKIQEIKTKLYSVEQILREIDPLAPKPDIVILHKWAIIPHPKGPYLFGLATNHPKWPNIVKKEMSSSNVIGKSGNLIVTKSGTKYDLQVENVAQEAAKGALLACLIEV